MALTLTLSPQQQRRLLSGAAAGLAAIGWLIFFFVPMERHLVEVGSQGAALRQQWAGTRQGLQKLPVMEEELHRLESTYELPAAKRPEEEVPELLRVIAQLARNAQVQLLEVTPKASLGAEASGASGYVELPIEVQALGGFHQLGRFLDLIESSKNLVRVKELEIRTDEQDIWRHKAVILLQAYLNPGSGNGRATGSASP